MTDPTKTYLDARRYTRYSANLPCQVKLSSREFKGTVTNISCNGARIEGAEPVELGSYIELAVSNLGELVAKIRWRSEGKFGVEFVLDDQQRANLENRIIDLLADEL